MSTTTTMTVTEEKLPSYDINIPYTKATPEERARMEKGTPYPQYLPSWDPIHFDPMPPFTFIDPASRADPKTPHLTSSNLKMSPITPRMGTIVEGLDLSTLVGSSPEAASAKDELALLISQRKILVFPAQRNFLKAGFDAQQGFMDYFGKKNYQPVSGSITGHPGFHVIHRDGNKEELDAFFSKKTTSCLWHQDVSYECQPPGYVMLGLLQGPNVGGDTIFAAADEAYKRLSPTFQEMLDKIKVVHSSANMTQHTLKLGGLVRKDPITSIHPLVRVHPITKQKSIFFNAEFTTGFVGMKEVEFKLISEFLINHMMTGHDFQARVQWQPETIVIFDNRNTIHTACVDYTSDSNVAEPRHIFRLASMAEVPIPVQ